MLNYYLNKKYDQTYVMNFLGEQILTPNNNSVSLKIEPVKGILIIDNITIQIEGENNNQYVKSFFKWKNSKDWSNSGSISQLSGITICSTKNLELELLLFRIDDNNPTPTDIKIKSIQISGTFEFTKTDSVATLNKYETTVIIDVKDIYKIFKINDFQVISSKTLGNVFTIKFRFSQDDGITWSMWEPLTKQNITTVKWNKLRFVKMQYLCEKSQDTTSTVQIFDILLEGEFQNVSANYLKTNKYGVKQDCLTSYLNDNVAYKLNMNYYTDGLSCYLDSNASIDSLVSSLNTDNIWKPYEVSKITTLHNFLANNINETFGHVVEYHLTSPDSNGQDNIIHEYQLFNIVDMKKIKVIVPENRFPDNQVVINQFNLDLFDTFKINIMKDEFKKYFGIDKRPGEKDIIYFCQTNRMYSVKHAQIHKDVMNSGIYYNVILEKYETRANILNKNKESADAIFNLTNNSTLENLFGLEVDNEMKKISNKKQLKPRSFDLIRSEINSRTKLIEEKVAVGNIEFIESYYNFKNIDKNELGVQYITGDNVINGSDNRTIIMWFKFDNEYSSDKAITKKVLQSYDIDQEMYNLVDNLDENGGYKVWYQNDIITLQLNEKGYELGVELITNIWYGLVISINNRQGKVEMNLYRRDSSIMVTLFNLDTYDKLELDLVKDFTDIEYEMENNGFRAVTNIETDGNNFELLNNISYDIDEFYYEHKRNVGVLGSNINWSNLRIFNDVISSDKINNVLKESIITDSQYLIIADNCNKKLNTINFKNKNWK